MAARWGIVVGAAAIAGGIAWFALHDRGSATSSEDTGAAPESSLPASAGARTGSGSGSATVGRDGKLVFNATQRPASTQLPPSPMGSEKFEAQARDPDWAPKTEADIKHRFATGVRGGRLESTECRKDQCLLTMSGTQEEMSKVLADLETEGGLLGFADHILLTGPEERDGKMVIKAYAVFDRRVTDENN